MSKEFDYKGHHYTIVPIENSEECTILRDGVKSRRISKELAEAPMHYIDRLFKD